jgi:large subunit ribosomal protein L15
VNVAALNKLYSDGETVSLETLVSKGLIKKSETRIKLLGQGELKKKLDVVLRAVSASAREKIEKAGGKVLTSGPAAEITEQ